MARYIPEEHFKGIQNSKEECPLAFITPNGSDKASLSRIETVKSWAIGWQDKDKDNSNKFEVIKNVAMEGFSIAKEIRRWSTSNVVWRIEDPRGFQLEISSGNMAYLMANTVINHGSIQKELIWVRDGSQNFLLPVGSDEYKKYSLITSSMKNTTTLKDLTIGDYIIDGSGNEGMYLGGYTSVEMGNYDGKLLTSKRSHFIKMNSGNIFERSTYKNISVTKKGDPNDIKDYSAEIEKEYKSDYRIRYFFKKKPNIKEAIKSLRFCKSTTQNNYKQHDDKMYSVMSFSGDRGQASEIRLDAEINTMLQNFHHSVWYNNSDNLYQKVKNGTSMALIVTINDKDYIL